MNESKRSFLTLGVLLPLAPVAALLCRLAGKAEPQWFGGVDLGSKDHTGVMWLRKVSIPPLDVKADVNKFRRGMDRAWARLEPTRKKSKYVTVPKWDSKTGGYGWTKYTREEYEQLFARNGAREELT